MDTENLVQWNIRGLRSNYEELKLLLNKTSTSVVALQDCKLGEEQLSPRGYALLKGNCPAGEAALLINQRVVHTELTLNSTLHAVAATVTLNKTFTICSIYLTPVKLSLNLAWKIYSISSPGPSFYWEISTPTPQYGEIPGVTVGES